MLRVIAVFIVCLLAQPVFAEEFTVDARSVYHVGISTFIGAGINSSLIVTDVPLVSRVLTSAFGCLAIGAMKEFSFDGYPDYGDLFFNAVGCGLGIAVTEGVAVYVGKNQIGMSMQF